MKFKSRCTVLNPLTNNTISNYSTRKHFSGLKFGYSTDKIIKYVLGQMVKWDEVNMGKKVHRENYQKQQEQKSQNAKKKLCPAL